MGLGNAFLERKAYADGRRVIALEWFHHRSCDLRFELDPGTLSICPYDPPSCVTAIAQVKENRGSTFK